MNIFAVVLLIISALAGVTSLGKPDQSPIIPIALCVFFVLYLMGVGN